MAQNPTTKLGPVRITNDTGALVRSGLIWKEEKEGLSALLFKIGLAALILGIALLFYNRIWGILSLVGCAVALYLSYKGFFRLRSLVFTIDGNILTPHGLPHRENDTRIDGHHDEIASIEARGRTYADPDQDKDWERNALNVALISDEGDTFYVSRDLTEEGARKVAVQLNRALDELRAARRGHRDDTDRGDDLIH